MSLRETLLTSLSMAPKSPEPSKTSLDQFYLRFFGNAVACAEHRHSVKMKAGDVRHAASTLGFTIPEVLETEVSEEFKALTRSVQSNPPFNTDLRVEDEAYKCLYAVYEAASNGTVSSTPSKDGVTLKLESPTGVNANLFSRNLETEEMMDDNDESEEDESEESDEELEVDESEDESDQGVGPIQHVSIP